MLRFVFWRVYRICIGTDIDQNLWMKEQANVNSHFRLMYRKANYLSSETRRTPTMSFWLFLFLLVSWYISSFKQQITSATKQSSSFYLKYGPKSITQTELSNVGCLNVENRIKKVRFNHDHKIFNNARPSYLKNNFIKINEHHKHNTR